MGLAKLLSCMACGSPGRTSSEDQGKGSADAPSWLGVVPHPSSVQEPAPAKSQDGTKSVGLARLGQSPSRGPFVPAHSPRTPRPRRGTAEVAKLRRLSVAVSGSESLQLQRLVDLLRVKLGASFACVDVFGTARPCSCTLAASGTMEEVVRLAVPRLDTPADARELQVLLPPLPAHNTSLLSTSAFRTTPLSPLGSSSRNTCGAGPGLAHSGLHLHDRCSPFSPDARSHLGVSISALWERHSAPSDRPDRLTPSSTPGSPLMLALASQGGTPPALGLYGSAGSPARAPVVPPSPAAATHGLRAPRRATSIDALPKHIRQLAEQNDAELRSFWLVPLYDSGSGLYGGAYGSSVPATPTGGSAPFPSSRGSGWAADGCGAGSSGGDGCDSASGSERGVVGMLYLMGSDEQLFQTARDTLELFCRWLSDAVSEGQLRLLPDLLHALQHATCPDAAIAAVHTHLSQFFTHRTQGMSEVLVYPAFTLGSSSPNGHQPGPTADTSTSTSSGPGYGRTVLMLPKEAHRQADVLDACSMAAHCRGGTCTSTACTCTGAPGTAAAAAAAPAPAGGDRGCGAGPGTALEGGGVGGGVPVGPRTFALPERVKLGQGACCPTSGAKSRPVAPGAMLGGVSYGAISLGTAVSSEAFVGDGLPEHAALCAFSMERTATLLQAAAEAVGSIGRPLSRHRQAPALHSPGHVLQQHDHQQQQQPEQDTGSSRNPEAGQSGGRDGAGTDVAVWSSAPHVCGKAAVLQQHHDQHQNLAPGSSSPGPSPRAAGPGGRSTLPVSTDVWLLPGQPQYVVVGVVQPRDAARMSTPTAAITTTTVTPTGITTAVHAETAAAGSGTADAVGGGGGGLAPAAGSAGPAGSVLPPVQVALYLSFSESLRPELAREVRATLDALLVLLSAGLASTFGEGPVGEGLAGLLHEARRVG